MRNVTLVQRRLFFLGVAAIAWGTLTVPSHAQVAEPAGKSTPTVTPLQPQAGSPGARPTPIPNKSIESLLGRNPPSKFSVLKKTCPHCGRQINSSATFCIHCGRAVYSPSRPLVPIHPYYVPVSQSAPSNPKIAPSLPHSGPVPPHSAQNASANKGGLAKIWAGIAAFFAALAAGVGAAWRKITGTSNSSADAKP